MICKQLPEFKFCFGELSGTAPPPHTHTPKGLVESLDAEPKDVQGRLLYVKWFTMICGEDNET